MNRVYKVIYNRARNLYQVVSEIVHSRGKTKSLTAQHQHERLTTAILIALFAMGTSLPVGWADEPTTADTTVSTSVRKDNANAVSGGEVYNEVRPTDDTNTKYVKSTKTTAENLTALDTQVKQNADAIAQKADTTALDTKADKTDLEAKADRTELNAKANTSMDNLTDAGKQAIQALIAIQNSDNVTVSSSTDDTNKTKTFTITVKTNGAVDSGNAGLVTGGTVYSEVRPSEEGNYVKPTQTTAKNLTAMDAAIGELRDLSNITTTGKKAIKNLLAVVGDNDQVTVTPSDDSSTGKRTYTVTVKKDGAIAADNNNLVTGKTVYEYLNASNLNRYFKVNPEITTNADNTKTYAADAVANGTNSVAIGPNAKTATYTTTVTSGDSTTTTETAADHAVAIGDGATVNAAGDQGIALGKGAVTGEAEASTSDGTTTTTTDAKGGESSVAIGDSARANGNQALAFGKGASVLNPTGTTASKGSTAIGNGAKVDGGDNSIALGTNAAVNTVSDAMALGNGATINKTATGSIAIGKAAVTGGADKPITLTNGTTGTLAAAGGEDSIAIGNGAVSEGKEALALGKGAKVTNAATGGDSAAAIVKNGSAAIGDGATVANSATSMAIGNGASITEGENTTVIGSGAKATQTKQAFVAGYQASSDSSAESSVAIGDNASTHSARTTAIGYKAEAHNADSIAIGSEAKTDDNGGGIAIGNQTSVAQGGIAIGNATQASNISSLAIGNGAVANVNQSISIGYNAGVNTTEDYKERNGSLVAIGTSAGNNVKGMQNVAIGASAGSAVLSSNNIAIGTNAGYGIKNVTSETDTNPQNGYNISIGAGANYTEGNTNQNIVSSIAIGHNTHAANRAVALGEGASAQGDAGMALGNSATSSGSGSIAIGNTASAANGNVAIGAGAHAIDQPTGAGKWTNTAPPSYYISVGGKGNASDSTITLRRISNVADGSADQDVVTVKQLQKVSDDLENTIKGIDTTQLKTYSTKEIDNKIAEVNQKIKDSGIKYFSINSASQSTNSNNTGANGDGDADAMAIGPNAKASSVKALAIGNNVSASGTLSIAIGTASNPSTDTTTAETPHPTSSEGTSSVAVGTSAIAQTNDSIAIGTRAATYTANTTSTPVSTVGVQSIAIGFSAETRDDNAISIGTKSKANSADAVAIGDGAEALNTSAVVIGKASTAEGSDSVTIGMSNANNGKAVITTGNSNRITNSQGVKDTVQNSGLYGSSNAISSVSSSNTSNAITDVYAVGNGNNLNQMGEKNVLTDVSIMGNQNAIENGTAGAYTQTVKQIAVVGSGNTVKGNTQVDAATWGTVQRDTILGYKNTVDATNQSTPVSNLQILGNDVKATLGNSVYLGTGSSATASKSATAEAITLAKEQGDAEAIASDEYKKATTEAEQTAIKQKYEAQYIHAANIAAMDQDGISAGITNYDKDYTYGNDSAYTYAGSQATGVVTVGSKDATRRIQNVSAGLVGPNSFGGDNSTFGDVATSDVNVVAKGSNEKLAITGGAEGVSNTTTTDGKSVTTVDGTKITDKNIAVIAEDDALHVKLASNLKDLNTAQLGKTTATTTKADDGTETTTYNYQETLKLDGTGDNGGTLALKDAKGENGVTLRTSGATKTADVTGAETNRLLVNDKTVATTDDGLKFGGDTGTDSARKLNSKLTVKGGATTGLSDNNNIGVVSDGKGTLTVKLNKNVNLGTDGSLTTGNSTLNNTGLTITDGPKFTSTGISANDQQIKDVKAGTDDTDAANYSQIKQATTTLTTGRKDNVTVTPDNTAKDGHTNYTIAVDNLAVKANGTGTTVAFANGINFKNGTNTTSAVDSNGNVTIDTKNLTLKANGTNQASVSMDGGINFKDGTNTTATVGTDGMVTISATHNKLDSASYTASKPSDSSNQTTVKLKDTDGNETTLNLTDTYTTVSKNTDHIITFKRNDGSTPVSISLDDLNGASNEALTKAAAKATTTVIKGTNVDSVDDDMTSADGHHIYKVNVSNLGVKVADGQKTSVALSDGLVFGNGTNTTASVGDNGAITFNVSNEAIKTQAKDALDVVKGNDNVSVDTTTSPDGTKKTFTISAKDTYTTVTKDADHKTVTFTRNDGDSQTVSLSDLGGITAAQDKYVTGGKVTYNDKGEGTVALTGNNGLAASITDLKDTKVSSGAASYVGTQGNASGSATLTMNDGSTATISGLKDDYITSASVVKENNHVTMTRLGGGTVDLDLNPILGKYSLSDYRLVGSGTTEDQPYTVSSDGKVTLNVVDSKNAANKKTIQITGLASQSGVNAGRTTVKSSDSSVTVSDSTANSDTHTYDIKVDYSKIPANLKVQYSGDNGTSGSNTMDTATAFSGTAGQIVTTAANGKVSFKLADDISGIQSVTTGDAKLATTGLTITEGPSVLKTGINAGGKTISNVGDAVNDTDAATLKQVKNARTIVAAGSNVASVTPSEGANNQMTYTVNVDNLSVKSNDGTAKEVTLKTGLNFKNGTNTTASVGDNGEVKYDLNSTLTGLTSVTAGNSTLDNSGLTIKEGTTTKVAITGDNVTMGGNIIHNVGDGVAATDAVNKGQLDALQSQVSGGWNLSGTNSEGTAVTAKIGAGKTVTYADGTYTKPVITKDDTTGNATVKVDVTTGTFGSGTGDKAGTVTSIANGLATTQDVADAINSASISVVADNTSGSKKAVKAGNTVHFANDGNLTLVQGDNTSGEATFTYGLNKEISLSKVTTSDTTKGSTVQTAEGITTTDAAGNTYIQNGQGITLTPKTPEDGKTAVTLSNKGLNNGGNVISGVGAGTADTDAVNVSQLKKVQDQVGSGWQIAGNDGTKVADIGAGKKVAFKSSSKYLTTSTARSATGESDTGADVTYSLKTTALASGANGTVASIAEANDGLVTAQNIATVLNSTYWSAAATAIGSGSVSSNSTAASIKVGTQVTFTAGNNLSLTQDGTDFTYALLPDLTSMNTIRFGGTLNNGNWSGGLLIGKQAGSGANTAEGNYITGLSNTKWDRATISENSNMAATEGQLKQAIENITTSGSGTGGFGLQADTGNSIMQDLRKTIQIKGDGEGTQEGNIKTSNEGGTLRIHLNKALDLSKDGSVQVGTSKMSNGTIQLGEDADEYKIRMDSAKGTAAIGGVTVDGANKTVSGLANTTWDADKASQGGYKGSTKAATESQLAEAISTATSMASQDEAHIQSGTYAVGDKSAGATDDHNVSIKVVNGKGDQKGMVTISDVAKASEVGDVGTIAKDIQNKNGDATKPTSVVDAINNLNDKVGDKNYTQVKGKEIDDGDSATTAIGKLNNRMNDIYTSSTQHSSVSTVDANLTLSEGKNASGGTDYKLGLNKEHIDLGHVTIKGNTGSIEAKSMKSDSFTAGDTVVNKDGVKVGDKSALTGDSLKVGGKTYVDDKGVDANGQAIRNVGDGKNDGDAVNVKQVNDLAARQGEAIGQNAAHINQLDRAVNRLDSRINRVGAGAAALAALHPGNYDPDDKVDFAAGFGNYRGASAAAVGMYYHPDETTTMSVGASFGGGENMVNAGITWKMGKDSGHMRTQAAQKAVPVQFVTAPTQPNQPTEQVKGAKASQPVTAVTTTASGQQVPIVAAYLPSVDNSTRAENDELKELLARQTAILEKLAEQKTAPAQAAAPVSGEDLFPDVPENHWAYDFVAKLAQAGALKDCRVEDPANNPMLTRNDFAQILYTALKNGATKNPALNKDGGLNHLANEFRAELKNVKR